MANYQAFHCSRIGAAHVSAGLPMQDRSKTGEIGAYRIAVVADGHGNRRHFRSDRGAEIACSRTIERIREFILNSREDSRSLDERLDELKVNICISWRDAVIEDIRENPWTDAELGEVHQILKADAYGRLVSGEDRFLPYGSTLCAVFADDERWIALQLGDGCFVCIDRDGEYTWPMPESLFNEGNRTSSLCMPHPMDDFRHCTGTGHPAGLLVFTDGIEKVFPSQGKDIVSLLHWIWKNEKNYGEAGIGNLEATLDQLTVRSRIGDDVSIAGLVDPDAGDIVPKMTETQARIEEEQRNARIRELQSSLSYNRQRLRKLMHSGGDAEAIQKLQTVIERNRQELAWLAPDLASDEPEEILEPDPVPSHAEENSTSAARLPDQEEKPHRTELIRNEDPAEYKTELLPNRKLQGSANEQEDRHPFGEEPPAEADPGFRLRAEDRRKKTNRQTGLRIAAIALILAAGIMIFLLIGNIPREEKAARATERFEQVAGQLSTATSETQLTATQSYYGTVQAAYEGTRIANEATAAELNTVQAEWTQTAEAINAGSFRLPQSGEDESEPEDTPVPDGYIEQQMQTEEAEITAVAGAVEKPELMEPTDFTHETPVPEDGKGTPIAPQLIEFTLSPTPTVTPTSTPTPELTDTLTPTGTPTKMPTFTPEPTETSISGHRWPNRPTFTPTLTSTPTQELSDTPTEMPTFIPKPTETPISGHRWPIRPTFTPAPTRMPYMMPTNTLSSGELLDLGEDALWNGNDEEALAYLLPAAEGGNATAQRELGSLYENDQKYSDAWYWYRKAAENGDAYALTLLGNLYFNGNGVTKNDTTARDYYRQAAEKNDPVGLFNLGYMYEEGLGGPKSFDRAVECYQKSAELGYEPAIEKLESLGYPPR